MQEKNLPENSLPKSAVGDIAEHPQAEALLRTRLRLSEIAHAASVDDLTQAALDEAEQHTASRVGYFHFVDADQQHVTLQVWSTNTLKHMCRAEGKGSHYPISQAGVWVDCFHARAPVIHNDYAGLSHKKGLPAGHAPIVRDLGVPVLRGGRVVAIMGVGNKESDYTPHDVAVLQDLASWVMDLVSAKQAQAALARVASFPELNPNPIAEVDRAGQVHYANASARRLFPDLAEQGLRHPWLAGCESVLSALQAGQTVSTVREVVVGGRCYQQTLYYVAEEQRLRLYGTEITERKRAEEAVRQSEERYRTLFNTLLEGFCVIEVIFDSAGKPADYRFLEVNAAFEAQTGLKNAQGRRMRELAPDHEAHWFEIYGKVALTGEPARFVNEARALNRWYDVTAYRVGGPESRKVAILFSDISERIRAEKALRELNLSLELRVAERTAELRETAHYARSLLEASLDPLVTIGPDGKITDVNVATETVTGRARAALIGTDFSDYFTEPDKARAGYQQVFREGFVRDYPLELRRRDGHITSVLYNATVYRDERGKVIGLFAAARDVTVQKQASQYARSLLEAALDPLVTISADGKITDVNEAAVKVTGVPREQLIGTDFSNYFTEPEKAREGYQRVFAEGFVTDYPLTVRHRQGGLTDVLYNASVYKDARGNVLGVFAAARDITERKRAEEEIRGYTEDLRRSNQELEHFAYVASHDLQEPLRAVSSFSQLLARRYEGKLDDDANEFIAFIIEGAKRMQTLINDLLSFSRIGTRGHAFGPVDCEEIHSAAMDNLDVAIAETGAVITHNPLPTVSGDPTQLTQLFQNLFSNAIKFRRPKESPRIHVSAAREDGVWRISVRDNGIGIAPQYFERIFIIFQRLHGRAEYPGTGIGLAVCKKIVERHGGRMWVDSEPGKGSTFHFTIPDKGKRDGNPSH